MFDNYRKLSDIVKSSSFYIWRGFSLCTLVRSYLLNSVGDRGNSYEENKKKRKIYKNAVVLDVSKKTAFKSTSRRKVDKSNIHCLFYLVIFLAVVSHVMLLAKN